MNGTKQPILRVNSTHLYQISFKLTHSTKSLIIKMIRAQMEWT